MDPYSSSSSSSSSSGASPQVSTEDIMDQVKLQLAQAYAEEFLETLRGKCFEKCITKPGSSLSVVRVVVSQGVWIATLKPPVSSAELFSNIKLKL
nr:mitochondrial import inner membrane translocase subunit Tim13-like [Coffea arabica]